MKKIFVIILIALILSGCSQENIENVPVVENIADYNISYKKMPSLNGKTYEEIIAEGHDVIETSEINVLTFSNIDDLWDNSDYVLIASPESSYAEATQFWYDGYVEQTFTGADLVYSYSKRTFKVNKVYKGENLKLKEIDICEHVITEDKEMRVMNGSYPTQQGEKYILFLYKANTEEEQYFPLLYQGKYSLNDSDNKEQKNISQDMYKQVKEKIKDVIK